MTMKEKINTLKHTE